MWQRNSQKLSPEKLEGALRLAFQIYRDTVHNPVLGTDREHLMRAVQEGNILALKELKSKNKFSLVDIVKAAIDKDQDTIVEEFSDEIQNNEAVTLDALLDYSISKKAVNTSRKLSGTLSELGRRAMPLLTMAIEEKDTDYVNQILDENFDDLEELHESPLHMAARSASAMMARSLTERNSKWVNMRASFGRTPLHIAAEEGSADVCEALLECGADVNAKDDRGRTPLFCCVEKRVDGDVECMEVLFKHKARVEEKSSDQLTALHVAARGGNKVHVKMLIAHNAHLDSRTPDGETALELIAQKVPSALEEFTKRLDKGIRLEDPENETLCRLDFRKLFSVEGLKTRDTIGDVKVFLKLKGTPFMAVLEHPLVKVFLQLKMKQVQMLYWLFVVSHLIFSLGFSVYAILMFSILCPPSEETRDQRYNFGSTETCDMKRRPDAEHIVNTINVTWIFLLIFLPVFTMKESAKIPALPTSRKNFDLWWRYISQFETIRNNTMIVLMFVLVFVVGRPLYLNEEYKVYRWQYYMASIATFLTWLELLVMIGRDPMFGKYIQFFRSVSYEMLKFALAYSPMFIGFMMMLMILFSEHSTFNLNFLGVFGKVLVMMTGEFDYEDLMYPTSQRIENNTISDSVDYNYFPGLSHITILLFIVLVSIVMMNLLVALAVNDMKKLAKNAKRDQLYSQVELISYMERLESLWIFQRILPKNFQDFFRTKLMRKGKGFRMTLDVHFCDSKKQILPKPLRNELLDFCMRVEKKKQHDKREKAKEDRRDVLEEKYDALKETCDKMELLLKELTDAQLKREEMADRTEEAGRSQSSNHSPEADLDERF